MTGKTLIIVGKGESWPTCLDLPWPKMAVSGAICALPFAPQYFVTLDKPGFFPTWLLHSEVTRKLVPFNELSVTNSIAEAWSKYPGVERFPYQVTDGLPCFDDSGPVSVGPLPRNYSLFAAVQLAPRLGYRQLYFSGVDLHDNELRPIVQVLREWYLLARQAGIEWYTLSAESALAAFVPHVSWEACVA